MPETPSARLKVLWATDGSSNSTSAIPLLRDLVLPVSEKLYVLTVAPNAVFSGARPDPAYLTRISRSARTREMAEARAAAEKEATALDPDVGVEVLVRWGHPIQEVIRASNSVKADLVVMAAKGHTNLRLIVVGSVTTGVAQNSTKPLLIARPGSRSPETILVGYHGSPAARKALRFLRNLNLHDGTRIVLVNAIEPFAMPEGTPVAYRRQAMAEAHTINERMHADARRRVEAIAEELAKGGHKIDTEVVDGPPGLMLDEAAKRLNADLIVVGSRKPDPVRHYLLGSTAEKLVRHAQSSVLVVR